MAQHFIGKVVSTKMAKTAMVMVERVQMHSFYPKMIRLKKKYMVHDEVSKCLVGDIVEIRPCRPRSRHKRFEIADIIKRPLGI